MERWQLLDDDAFDAANNMARDEALLQTATSRPCPILRVYRWDRPSISFGYFQSYPGELASDQPVVRRLTGGGIVYHGQDTTYTIVVPPTHRLFSIPTVTAYREIHEAIAASVAAQVHQAPLTSPRGEYECFQKPVDGDVVFDGRKLAGGAQRRTQSGMLHQGSIARRLSTSRVVAGFQATMKITFDPMALPIAVAQLADRLAREKYATVDWNQRTRRTAPISSG